MGQDLDKAWLRIVLDEKLPAEGYRLHITAQSVRIEASSSPGAVYAFRVLQQLNANRKNELPCGFIEDWPDFPIRGFMLDVSRSKVPDTYGSWNNLFDALAKLNYNQLQLYTEHTFAFKGHSVVWGDASPYTRLEMGKIRYYQEAFGIEVVANFNSFGHFERWLKHPEYKHLAECPDGFVHPLKGQMTHGTTLRPNAASLKFLDKLWAEYLPLFQSKRFNLGGDEPWELGLGWSKPLVKKFGQHRVYLDFLKKLHQQAAKHGKEILFWGDILLESPELVKEVPADATALLWGYEANHPFAEQCAKLAAAKRKFWVCPGTSAWNTFTGRTDNMLANLESAAKHGLANGAEGFLLTSWGDGGNHQPWPIMDLGLTYAAGLAWNQKGTRRTDLPRAVDAIFNEGRTSNLGQILLELGRAENAVKHPKPNRSRHYDLFFATRAGLKKELKTLTDAELKKILKALLKVQTELSQKVQGKIPEEKRAAQILAFVFSELRLGADMAAWAIKRARLAKAGKSTRLLAGELKTLIGRFEEIWVRRARVGGLHEATARMRAVEQDL